MSTDFPSDDPTTEVVRRQSWPCDRAAELELTVDVGRIRVDLVAAGGGRSGGDDDGGDGTGGDEADGDEAGGDEAGGDEAGGVHVEVRHDPSAGGSWAQGLGGLINWLGSGGGDPAEVTAQAVRAAEISWSESSRRLVVRSSEELPLRVVPLVVTVTAPEGSRLAARTGSGDVTVGGTAGWAAIRTGSGEVGTDAVSGDADVTTGSGDIRLGAVGGRGRVRTGSGGVRLAAVHGSTEVRASSGDVVVTEVSADLGVRTGSGEVTVGDARAGRLSLTTGSGDLRVGVHPGVAAELDLSSGSGHARSELDVGSVAPEQAAALVVTGRTGSGDVLVTRATVSA